MAKEEFDVIHEPPQLPAGMKIVGLGVILSCLALSFLFGWGVYLNLKKPAATAAAKKEVKQSQVVSDDVTIANGLLSRKNPPAFTVKIPPTMNDRPKSPGQIYSGGQDTSPFSFQVAVADLGKVGFDDWMKGAADGWTKGLKALGSREVKVTRIEPIKRYGEYQAREMEIQWLWTDGTTRLTNLNHFILKGDKVITLSGTLIGDHKQLTDIYDTVNLNPSGREAAAAAKEGQTAREGQKPEEKTAAGTAAKPAQTAGEDIVIGDGILIRRSPPAFTLKFPTSMKDRPKSPGQIYSGGQDPSPFSLQVAVNDLEGATFEAWVKGAGDGWIAAFKGLGSKSVKIVRTEPIKRYGKFPAMEMEIQWLWTDGNTLLTNINHFILKENKVITLSSTLIGDHKQATAMYDTIDLNPSEKVLSGAGVKKTGTDTGDGSVADGLLTRKNPPAFTIKLPSSMQNRPKAPGQLYSGGQDASPFSLQVAVYNLGGVSFDAWVKSAGEGWISSFKSLGSRSVKIVRTEPIQKYGKFKAVEMEIQWLWTDGNTQLTNINHYILKGEKVISLSSTLVGDPKQATGMYENINLNP